MRRRPAPQRTVARRGDTLIVNVHHDVDRAQIDGLIRDLRAELAPRGIRSLVFTGDVEAHVVRGRRRPMR